MKSTALLALAGLAACTNAAEVGTTREAPAGLNQAVTITAHTCTVRVALLGFLRDGKTQAAIKAANRVVPFQMADEAELVAAEVRIEVLAVERGSCAISNGLFGSVSSAGQVMPDMFVNKVPEPALQAELYPGASAKGWIVVQVRKTDQRPLLTFGRRYDGTGGAWWRLY